MVKEKGLLSSDYVTVPQCRRCSLNNARGMEIHYNDGAIDFKCDTCGKRSRLGYGEESMRVQSEDKRGRERAERNRSRYRRERYEELDEQLAESKERPEFKPDEVNTFHDILNPGYMSEDDGEVYQQVHKGV